MERPTWTYATIEIKKKTSDYTIANWPLQTWSLIECWRNSKSMLQEIENWKTFNFITRWVTFMNSSDPAHLTNDSVQTKLNKLDDPDIIGFSRKVSAKGLSSLYEPKLHEHSKLNETDKEIWDKSYLEEYMGLHEDTKIWEYITEDEYKALRPIIGNALPSMAISKVKTDEDGTPERAKYWIVVLGNLDHQEWNNSNCFAPILSALKLKLLVALAVQLRCIPKSGDVSQAFVQCVLLDDKK